MIEIENTGEEIETNSLNITLAIAVPKKAKIKIYPNEVVTSLLVPRDDQGKSDKRSTSVAGMTMAKKLPKAIPKEETPCSLYLITLTLIE